MDTWSKGEYSRRIPESIMVMERPPKVNPPSGRVPRQVLPAIPISESRRRWISGRNRVTGNSSRVSGARAKYMPKESLRGGPGGQVVRQPPGHAVEVPGWGWPPRGPLRASGVFQLGYFLVFFLEF